MLTERDLEVAQLQQECEEIQGERKRRSIAVSDLDKEIDRVTKVPVYKHTV